ncbi:uncharacterized protein LOC143069847 [Mytilus galloprovincialis]|uniref:uncharacterized protein LOC143069847 n=1 Tax=Mytilus galloprovincialis TaxID=29158 RepID=UPI003F7BD237
MGLVKLTTLISFWILIVNGSCPFEYYQCSDFLDWCCPSGYTCTGNNSCDNYNSIDPTAGLGGAIVGGILGGIVLIAVVCGCISAAIKSNYGTFCSVLVSRRNLVDGTASILYNICVALQIIC